MNHERFRQQFEEMGFDVTVDQEPPEDEELGVLVAENDEGDQLFWSVIDSPEEWGVYIDPDAYTLDDATFRWEDLTIDGDDVVVEGATGTRRKEFGYGRAGFDGELRIGPNRSKVTETNTY